MINLLPPEVKKSYSFARRNVGLRQWVIYCAIALVGLGAIVTYGILSIHQTTTRYQNEISRTENQFKQEKYTETQKQIKDIAGSFKLVVQVLGNEVLFSQILKQIAAITPAKANLTGLNIGQAQTALDITANVPDYDTATQLQVNLSDPANKIFTKADIISINCSSQSAQQAAGTEQTAAYPCNVTIRALFADNNPYLFVNSKGLKK